MSVDDRLREAFGETDRSWDEQVPAALAALTARQRRESAVRRGAAAALVAAGAVATVTVAVSQRADDAPSPTEDPTSPPTGLGAEPNALDGTWVSEPLTRADVRRAARLAGDAGDAAAMLSDLPTTPFRVALYVNGDRSSMHAAFRVDGQPEETVDEENVTVSEDRVVMQPMFDEGENVHTYVLDNGTLRFAFVSTTEGETDGVPGEAWQRLVYDASGLPSGK
jgi:hypothetical protein